MFRMPWLFACIFKVAGCVVISNGLAIKDCIMLPFFIMGTLFESVGCEMAPGSCSDTGLITALVFINWNSTSTSIGEVFLNGILNL